MNPNDIAISIILLMFPRRKTSIEVLFVLFVTLSHPILLMGCLRGRPIHYHPKPSKTTTTVPTLIRMTTASIPKYSIKQIAGRFSLDYRCYLQNAEGKIISPFHDVPLFHDESHGILNMIVEVPRFSNAKLEISKDEWMNPIKQDVKKGALRFVKNCYPYHGYLWNYGALPQTWESPMIPDHDTGLKGDNDPIDVVEIGSALGYTGQVKQVKVLGALAMLDEGETDWKIIAIDINDPLATKLDDSDDLDRVCPGLLDATRTWFKVYKIPDGKPVNSFAFGGAVKNKAFAMSVIRGTNQMWQELILGKVPTETQDYKISIANRENHSSLDKVNNDADREILGQSLPDNPIPESVNGWAYIPKDQL